MSSLLTYLLLLAGAAVLLAGMWMIAWQGVSLSGAVLLVAGVALLASPAFGARRW